MSQLLVFVVGLSILVGCTTPINTNEEPQTVFISGVIEEGDSNEVALYQIATIGGSQEEAKTIIAADGSFEVQTETPGPAQYTLYIDGTAIPLFLEPGCDLLEMKAHNDDIMGTLLFSGAGAAVHNYLADKERKKKNFDIQLAESNVYKLELDEFLKASDGRRRVLSTHFTTRVKTQNFSKDFLAFEKYQLLGEWATPRLNYPTYYGYYSDTSDFEVGDTYYDFEQQLIFDDPAAIGSSEYRGVLGVKSRQSMTEIMEADSTLEWQSAYVLNMDKLMISETYHDGIKDYLLANEVNTYLDFFGVDGLGEKLAELRERDVPAEWMEPIEENYKNWKKLAKGQVAPDFEYESLTGESVALSDFRGKVVYVDVWATWCTPCKRELPSAKKLKASYADIDDVVFLYVSVDDQEEAWRTYLENDPGFKGVHLITGTGWKSELTDAYMIKGIPRYLLIDRQGNIATANAPRPSSTEKIIGMIDALLDSEYEDSGG